MKERYLVDLNNEEDWMYPAEFIGADGHKGEDQRTIFIAEGPDRMYCVTDSVMYPRPAGEKENISHMCHEHQRGWEDFFVDSGSMDLYANGMKSTITPGNIIHLQAYEAHGMEFHSPVKYRGFFHGLANYDNQAELYHLRKTNPQIMQDPEYQRIRLAGQVGGSSGGRDFYTREPPVCEEVPIEQNPAVRNISRPLAIYKLDGVDMKQLTRRWENGGKCEMWALDMVEGFTAASDKFLNHAELYYVTAGQVKFVIWGEEVVAGPECVVKIPALRNFTIEALSDAVMYDAGGSPRWQAFLEDRASILKYDPARAKDPQAMQALREKFGVQISVG